MDEAFATYLHSFYSEITNGEYEEGFNENSSAAMDEYMKKTKTKKVAALNQSASDYTDAFSVSKIIYNRGHQFLVALRNKIGTENFDKALKKIYNTYKFKILTTESVLKIFQDNTDNDLTEIYDYFFELDEY